MTLTGFTCYQQDRAIEGCDQCSSVHWPYVVAQDEMSLNPITRGMIDGTARVLESICGRTQIHAGCVASEGRSTGHPVSGRLVQPWEAPHLIGREALRASLRSGRNG